MYPTTALHCWNSPSDVMAHWEYEPIAMNKLVTNPSPFCLKPFVQVVLQFASTMLVSRLSFGVCKMWLQRTIRLCYWVRKTFGGRDLSASRRSRYWLANKIAAYHLQNFVWIQSMQIENFISDDAREYHHAAILMDLQIQSIQLLTNNLERLNDCPSWESSLTSAFPLKFRLLPLLVCISKPNGNGWGISISASNE